MSKFLKYFIIFALIAFVISGYFFVFDRKAEAPVEKGNSIVIENEKEEIEEKNEDSKGVVAQKERNVPEVNDAEIPNVVHLQR